MRAFRLLAVRRYAIRRQSEKRRLDVGARLGVRLKKRDAVLVGQRLALG